MLFKSFIAPIFLLALTSSVNVHAAISPDLGVKRNAVRSDVRSPSTVDPHGNINIAQNSTADADGTILQSITPGTHGSRSIKRGQVDGLGIGKRADKASASPSATDKATPDPSGAAKGAKNSADKSAAKDGQSSSGKDDKGKKGKKKDDKDKKGKKKDDKKKDDKKGDKGKQANKSQGNAQDSPATATGSASHKRSWSSRPLAKLA